jgi:hypothetical protein
MEEADQMTIKDFEVHARSKKDVYDMMNFEKNIFLLPMPQATHYYVADIISGDKKVRKYKYYFC